MENSANINKLINTIDENKRQCSICKRWKHKLEVNYFGEENGERIYTCDYCFCRKLKNLKPGEVLTTNKEEY